MQRSQIPRDSMSLCILGLFWKCGCVVYYIGADVAYDVRYSSLVYNSMQILFIETSVHLC